MPNDGLTFPLSPEQYQATQGPMVGHPGVDATLSAQPQPRPVIGPEDMRLPPGTATVGMTPPEGLTPEGKEGFQAGAYVAPQLGMEQAVELAAQEAAQGSGPFMTRGNRLAASELGAVSAEQQALRDRMGANYMYLGQEKAKAEDNVAMETTVTNAVVAEMDAQAKAEDDARQERLQKFEKEIGDVQKEYQRAAKDINPMRLMGKAGNRAVFAIAAALGGFAHGFSGGKVQNHALQYMMSVLDRDLEAQKENVRGMRDSANMLVESRDRFRQLGMDARSSHLAARGVALEQLGRYAEVQSRRATSEEHRIAVANLALQLKMQGNQDRMAVLAQAAKPSGSRGASQLEILERAAEASQKIENVKAKQLDNAAKQNPEGAPQSDAALQRQSKLAEKVSNVDKTVQGLERALELAKSEKVGWYGASNPDSVMPGVDNDAAGEFNKIIKFAEDQVARNYGGPVTASDREIAKERYGTEKFWRDKSMVRHLEHLLELTKKDRDRVLSGQPAQDVKAVERNTRKGAPTQEQLEKQFNARKRE